MEDATEKAESKGSPERRRRQFADTTKEVEHLDLKLRRNFDEMRNKKTGLRAVHIKSVALTSSEVHTWLQTHEIEMNKMRDLFCRKKPSKPAVVSYVDATFLQLTSFRSVNVVDMSQDVRIQGIRQSRKASVANLVKKVGAGQIRDNIDKLLYMALGKVGKVVLPAKSEEPKGEGEGEGEGEVEAALSNASTVSDPAALEHGRESDSESATASDDRTAESKSSAKSSNNDIQTAVDEKQIDTAVGTKQIDTSVETPKKARWSLWGSPAPPQTSAGNSKNTEVKDVLDGTTTTSTEEDDEEEEDEEEEAKEEEQWSDDGEEWDAAMARLQVDEKRDHFYIHSNDADGDYATLATNSPRSPKTQENLGATPAPMPTSLHMKLYQAAYPDAAPLVPKKPPIIVNCLDISLNRFRFLDFSTASDSLNWSVKHLVALNLSGNLLVSLDGIESCVQLRVLNCNDNLLTNMVPLKGCKHLRRLKISGNRLKSVSLLSSKELIDYYNTYGALDGDIDVDDFDEDAELDADKISGLDDVVSDPGSPKKMKDSVSGGSGGSGNLSPARREEIRKARSQKYKNILGLPEIEYIDASENTLESLEGFRLHTRNSLVHLELRNCGILSHHLNHLRGLPLVRLYLDDNKIDNLKHTVAVLKSIPTVEHLAFLGNPISSNVDVGREVCDNGIEGNNFGSQLKLTGAARFKTEIIRARESIFKKNQEPDSNQIQRATIASPPGPIHSTQQVGIVGNTASIVDQLTKGNIRGNQTSAEEPKNPEVGKEAEIGGGHTGGKNYYTITVFDHVDNLKTFDHLAVPPEMYLELRRLKASVQGHVILRDIERHYAAEIESIQHIHANLASANRNNENLVQQVVKEKAGRLEEEMNSLMKFARDKLAEIQPSKRSVFQARTRAGDGEEGDVTGSDQQKDQAEEKLGEKENDNDHSAAMRFQKEKDLPAKNIELIREKYTSLMAAREKVKAQEMEVHQQRDEEKRKAADEAIAEMMKGVM